MTDIEQIFHGREVVYACLSRIFIDIPDDGFYEMLDVFSSAVVKMKDGCNNDDMQIGAEGLLLFLSQRKETHGKSDGDTVRAFTRLYCLSDSVPMSESVYTSPERLTMQKATGQVWKFYKNFAFDMAHYSNEPSDHIAYELMFMSYLSKKIAELALESDVEKVMMLVNAQKKFLTEHLCRWVDKFTEATCTNDASVGLYFAAARFLNGYILEDKKFLDLFCETEST